MVLHDEIMMFMVDLVGAVDGVKNSFHRLFYAIF